MNADNPFPLHPQPTAGLSVDPVTPAPFPGAVWYTAQEAGDGFEYRFAPGSLAAGARWLTAEFLTDAYTDLVLNLEFYAGDNPSPFMCRFTLLPQAQARLRFNLEAFGFNRWLYPREGACLKPTIGGWRVDPAHMDRMILKVLYKAPGPAHWCMTPLRATLEEPYVLTDPVILGDGRLLDELGQTSFRDWPGKTPDVPTLVTRLQTQLAEAPQQTPPATYSRWGGWRGRQVEGTGFFRTHHDGRRWWLVDPDGCLFWSTGADAFCPIVQSRVHLLQKTLAWKPDGTEFADARRVARIGGGDPAETEDYDYLIANFIRAFGAVDWRARWAEIGCAQMRRIGFNTCGNWSDTAAARAAGVPYVLPMDGLPAARQIVARVFRDLPDVFDPAFEQEAARYAEPLAATADDPALLGYFLMNEPTWGFARMLPAEGMLRNSQGSWTSRAFADHLKTKYGGDAELARAWGVDATLTRVGGSLWEGEFSPGAYRDLEEFSQIMVRRSYSMLGAACRRVDPHHLNLGARFASVPEDWIVSALEGFDVFSINCYKLEADERLGEVCARLGLPALIGEWHFGAVDVGLPAPGIGHAADQEGRGQAYRYFVETSAANPWCVGAHWFTFYDQSAIGRFDGENYNIGFLDVCHRPYESLVAAARQTHEKLYAVADGAATPFADRLEQLPRLNM